MTGSTNGGFRPAGAGSPHLFEVMKNSAVQSIIKSGDGVAPLKRSTVGEIIRAAQAYKLRDDIRPRRGRPRSRFNPGNSFPEDGE